MAITYDGIKIKGYVYIVLENNKTIFITQENAKLLLTDPFLNNNSKNMLIRAFDTTNPYYFVSDNEL